MSELLYRLGLFSAKRSWLVLTSWLLILLLAGVAFIFGFKSLSNSFEIPGTASGDVVVELQEQLPEFGGASGSVIYQTEDGSPLSEAQQSEITEVAAGAASLTDVTNVMDPFETENLRSQQRIELEDGAKGIADGRLALEQAAAALSAGQEQLDGGQAQLDAAKEQLAQLRAQAEAAGMPLEQIDAQQSQLDAQQAAVDAQQKEIDQGLAELEAKQAELNAGEITLENGQALLELAAPIRMVSEDGSTAVVTVAFTKTFMELDPDSKHGVIEYFEANPVEGTLLVFSAEIAQEIPEILGVSEIIGVVIAGVVLVIVLSSWLAAAFPLITAVVGVGIGAFATLSLSGVFTMTSVTPIIGVMLGLAVGIDYALFILNRHRKQMIDGMPVRESIALANGTSGTAVVFAGATVIVALLALNITGIQFLSVMGTVGAVNVLVAVLMAITAIPALLGLAGEKILGRKARARRAQALLSAEQDEALADSAAVKTEVKVIPTWRAVVTSVASIAVLLVIAIPALDMRLGLPAGDSEPVDSTAHQAFIITQDKFGAGATSPFIVTADLPSAVSDEDLLGTQLEVAQILADQEDVVAVAPVGVSESKTLLAFQLIPSGGPNDASTADLVHSLRELSPLPGDIELGVAGQAAINIDISQSLADIMPLYLVLVVGLSFLIMMLVFRSILVPLIATLGFVLSLFATLGVATAIFQNGLFSDLLGIPTPGPLLSFFPIILIGVLFGLAMDYQLFLATGMREAYAHGSPAKLAVAQGLRAGRRVVIAAALIMIAVFAGFIGSDSNMIKLFGVGLAVGVLFDAFVVRLLLMPALMTLLGKSAWWLPRWLDKILPNVDVEGAALERKHAVKQPVTTGAEQPSASS